MIQGLTFGNNHHIRWPGLPIAVQLVFLFVIGSAARCQQEDAAAIFARIHWTDGPARVALGSVAQMDLPAGYRFADAEGAKLFGQATQNPNDGSEVGIVLPQAAMNGEANTFWFILLKYQDIGYVKDEEKDALDEGTINGILDSIRNATEQENQLRTQHGWPSLTIVGWNQTPFYDSQTHYLTWAIATSEQGGAGVNYNSRVLGRTGVLSANMVITADRLASTVPTYRALISNVSFNQGQRYAEYHSGDKIAQYGLVGLMTGGAAVVAVKAWKGFAKLGAVLVALVAAGLAKLKSSFFRRSPQPAEPGPRSGTAPTGTSTATGSATAVIKCPVCGQANRVRPPQAAAAHPHCAKCKASLGA